jgi:Uma2 family endonuclease
MTQRYPYSASRRSGQPATLGLDADLSIVQVPAAAATLEGFRSWATSNQFPERGQVSFINHKIWIDMSPEEVETHNKVKTAVTATIANLNAQLDLGEFFADRTLLTNAEAGLSTEPDGAFVLWASYNAEKARLVSVANRPDRYKELEGAPDWVLEVVSQTSYVKDTRILRSQYHRAKISEYWLIDARHGKIDFQILHRRKRGYVSAPAVRGWRRSLVFGWSFRLERTKNRMGRWRYQLRVKEP